MVQSESPLNQRKIVYEFCGVFSKAYISFRLINKIKIDTMYKALSYPFKRHELLLHFYCNKKGCSSMHMFYTRYKHGMVSGIATVPVLCLQFYQQLNNFYSALDYLEYC